MSPSSLCKRSPLTDMHESEIIFFSEECLKRLVGGEGAGRGDLNEENDVFELVEDIGLESETCNVLSQEGS